jgi:hypothetical protein
MTDPLDRVLWAWEEWTTGYGKRCWGQESIDEPQAST